MKISRLIIKNYRNLKDVDICLGETVVLIGENNSGKSIPYVVYINLFDGIV